MRHPLRWKGRGILENQLTSKLISGWTKKRKPCPFSCRRSTQQLLAGPSTRMLRQLLLLLPFMVQAAGFGDQEWIWDDAISAEAGLEREPYQCDTTPEWRAEVVKGFVDAVGDDFEVVEGFLDFPAFSQPAGRYGLVDFPAEQAPPALCAIAKSVPSPYGPQLCNRTFVLGPRDAVVGLLCTPPPVRYFGLRSYTIFRFKPSPWLAAAELADPVNQLIINTTGTEPGDVFRKTTALISTGDGITQRKMHAALTKAGFPATAINTDVVSADRAHFRDFKKVWLRDRSDALGWLFRVSSFVNSTEVQPYFKQKWPILLLRAKKTPGLRPPSEPLNTPPLRPRGTGQSEENLQTQVDTLVSAITKEMRDLYHAEPHTTFRMDHIVPDIDKCLTDPSYTPIATDIPELNISAISTCGFFTRDALYTWMSKDTNYTDLTFPSNRVYYFVGVNQPLLNKSSYINIFMTAMASPQQVGRTFNFSAPDLAGSAQRYGPELPDVDKLFAVKLARTCGDDESFCTTVPVTAINTTEYVYVVQRQYLEPTTQIGPAAEESIIPLVLAFTLPSNSSADNNEQQQRAGAAPKDLPVFDAVATASTD